MSFHIESAGRDLIVRIDEVAGREQYVLDKIRDCRRSAWACPSGECLRMAHMEERMSAGCVYLTLSPIPGERLQAKGVEQCLRYMLGEVLTPAEPRKPST